MASMPIHNETDYLLTDNIRQHIIRDVHEYFGGQVRSIRVQYGIARHAFNTQTREVRYAFSPTDFGLFDITPLPEAAVSRCSPGSSRRPGGRRRLQIGRPEGGC